MSRRPARLLPLVVAMGVSLLAPGLIRADGTLSVSGSVSVSSIVVTLTLSATEIVVGKTVRADAIVQNVSPVRISNVVVELRAPSEGLRIKSATTQTISKLKPGASADVSYAVCGLDAGAYLLLARATVDGQTIESAARLLIVLPGTGRGC
jgi:hypothetical protein